MKRRLALWAMLAGCILCISACGMNNVKDDDLSSEIEEITFQNNSKSSSDKKEKGEDNSQKETPVPASTEERTEKEEAYQQIISKGTIKSYGGTIQIGDTGFELYNFVNSSAEKYTSIINKIAENLKGKAQIYDIVVPTSVGITLPDNKVKKINSSDQNKAIHSIYRKLNKNVTSISLYETLMQHRTEYIYFRTDHHWTSKGAYYAYQEFCGKKGLEANELTEYKKKVFGDYLGTFYTDTNKSKTLRQDRVKAFYPIDQKDIRMTYTDEYGGTYHSPVICDGSNYGTQLKYCAFIAGDNPYTVIQNKKIKDGSSCVVVKESYGNAFVPYLADHYQKIYVIDYRYWNGSIQSVVKKNKVKDVIFINNVSMTRNAYLIGKMAQVQ